MARPRKTRTPTYVRLSEKRIRQIEELVDGWSFETRLFVLRRLRQYDPSRTLLEKLRVWVRRQLQPSDRAFQVLRDPEHLSDWRRRFEVAGSQDASEAWNRILHREVDWHDYQYLCYLLERSTNDIFVPDSLRQTFDKLYRAHILKEYSDDPGVPRAPLVLVIGSSGSGKTATIKQAIEESIFASEVSPVVDLKAKQAEVMDHEPFWRSLEDVDPELAVRIERQKKLEFLRFCAHFPLAKFFLREWISRALSSLTEEGVWVDYSMVTPNDYQTAWAGEPGNYLRKAMGDTRRTCLRHLEEAHSAFGRPDQMSTVKSQQSSLVDTGNIILDEIIYGRRDCLLIATTDQPEQLDPAIFRRFIERGLVIDIGELWEDSRHLREVVRMEMLRRVNRAEGRKNHFKEIDEGALDRTVECLYPIFHERSLKITPAYVRRLIDSIISLKGSFEPDFLKDQLLVRDAFKSVAKNVHGALYKKLVAQMDRNIHWQDYIGAIKNEFSEMANNALYYNVNEEKGVVLTGPPGSGKTFMVRAWLGDNEDVEDLAVNLSDLTDPVNPLEGMVENLERVYDIAKMLSPSMVFFDEGDAVAPRRSQQGGSPYDKVTNKFLSIIDGELPLNRVFTVLTTNRLDILDPALIRSKRLKVLNVTGHLLDEDALRIVRKELGEMPFEEGLDVEEIVRVARSLCETPADYTAFAEKVRSLRTTEVEVLENLKAAVEGDLRERVRFVRFNYKILVGLLEGAAGEPDLTLRARHGEDSLLECLDEVAERLVRIREKGIYPITRWHLQSARQQLAASPMRKNKQQLDEFLETELSQEPQVGFVVGVGANDTTGVLLPIASSLVYKVFTEKLVVTGAVSTSAPGAAELDLAVQMTRQSAQEALTLVQNYLQSLVPHINISRLIGEFLNDYSLHHQLLSASYNVGGPSAGFALAINTLSAILHIPVLNDFGITGAPWIKGARLGEVGASVIIGGHRKKAEKVLQYLPRMFMPLQNYQDLEPEVLEAYRHENRDIRPVSSFSSLVPEVYFFGEEAFGKLRAYLDLRIRVSLETAVNPSMAMNRELETLYGELRRIAEDDLRRRVELMQRFVEGEMGWANPEDVFRPLTEDSPREQAN